MIRTYITAIYLLRDYADGGISNLGDNRNNAILCHRGRYLDEFIFPFILKKMGESRTLGEFYKYYTPKSTPEYGVVQSILMADDFDVYMNKYDKNEFTRPGYIREDYMQDLQLVFDNIINGRSIVLMEPKTIDAFNRFGYFCCDSNKPEFKPEYVDKANAAAAIVRKDRNVERQRLDSIMKISGNNGYNK